MINNSFVFNDYNFIFPLRNSNVVFFCFLLFSQRVQILKAEYKYGLYCTPLSQSDCRFFLVSDNRSKRLHSEMCVNFKYKLVSKTRYWTNKQTLWKIKQKFEKSENKKLYPTGSSLGLFYGTPKVHKLQQQQQQRLE